MNLITRIEAADEAITNYVTHFPTGVWDTLALLMLAMAAIYLATYSFSRSFNEK